MNDHELDFTPVLAYLKSNAPVPPLPHPSLEAQILQAVDLESEDGTLIGFLQTYAPEPTSARADLEGRIMNAITAVDQDQPLIDFLQINAPQPRIAAADLEQRVMEAIQPPMRRLPWQWLVGGLAAACALIFFVPGVLRHSTPTSVAVTDLVIELPTTGSDDLAVNADTGLYDVRF